MHARRCLTKHDGDHSLHLKHFDWFRRHVEQFLANSGNENTIFM